MPVSCIHLFPEWFIDLVYPYITLYNECEHVQVGRNPIHTVWYILRLIGCLYRSLCVPYQCVPASHSCTQKPLALLLMALLDRIGLYVWIYLSGRSRHCDVSDVTSVTQLCSLVHTSYTDNYCTSFNPLFVQQAL